MRGKPHVSFRIVRFGSAGYLEIAGIVRFRFDKPHTGEKRNASNLCPRWLRRASEGRALGRAILLGRVSGEGEP